MAKKFRNKYRISSARLQNWDYGNNGSYFITICTQDRKFYFGNIVNQQMKTNNIGKIAENIWFQIPNQFPNIELGNFVVMPNHVHGILIIDKPVETRLIASLSQTTTPSTPNESHKPPGGITGDKNPMIHQNISRIIRWYKGRCTFEARKEQPDFSWQPRFHDHIIRNEESYDRVSNYIINNPKNWNADKFHP